MNFLAHFFLSGDNPKIIAGNFIGDFVKGKNALKNFDSSIVKGIELHRSIDAFTDSHPIVTKSKERLRPKYRHYSGVIIDVFYDHFLAADWDNYHNDTLAVFTERIYKIVTSFDSILPAEAKHMLPYMITGNWLRSYASIEGINRALTGMSRRTPYVSKMEEASEDLIEHYDAFKKEFRIFFPMLVKHCSIKLQELNQPTL